MIAMYKIEDIDKEDMTAMVEGFPSMLYSTSLSETFLDSIHRIKQQDIQGICITGMGGSAVAGLLSKGLQDNESPIPILSIQDYTIPRCVNASWIIIAVSYSGNTEETLNTVELGIERGCTCLGITSGGKLKETLDSEDVHLIPSGFQPRAALPILFSIVHSTIQILIGKQLTDMQKVAKTIDALQTSWQNNPNPSKLASALSHSIPLFTGWGHLSSVAYRARCQVNENAKTAAWNSKLPEANHNEIESCGSFKTLKVQPVFLRSSFEPPKIQKRFEVTRKIYQNQGVVPISVQFKGLTRTEETLAHIFYLDTMTIELAKILDADPVSVDRIRTLKEEL